MVAAVAVGGALGAVLRYLLGEAFPGTPDGFPWTTFAINVSGSFLLALLIPRLRADLQAFAGPGVLGGFTTLSAYSEQTRHLLDTGHASLATAYSLGTLIACLAAVSVARRVT